MSVPIKMSRSRKKIKINLKFKTKIVCVQRQLMHIEKEEREMPKSEIQTEN